MKFLKFILLPLVLVVAGLLLYLRFVLPDVGDPENLKFEYSSQRIEHGKYLANAVAACMDCHSTRDWTKYSGPLVEGTLGKGGERFAREFGFPGEFYSKNITPYSLKDWTDGEILRAITSGVSKDGSALFSVMPHPAYGKLDKEDIMDIIAYLRSLPEVKNDVPKSHPDFPMNFILNTIPQKANFTKRPDKKDQLNYGKYLFTMASCNECHTKQEKGKPVEGMELAGGFEFPLPGGILVRSANITPDAETGIGSYTEEMFVKRFKFYADSAYVDPIVKAGEFNTLMPWRMYAQMNEEDLKAIYAYLKTLKPIKNQVTRFETATKL
jgi:mono/diheme cytochrome c family protein